MLLTNQTKVTYKLHLLSNLAAQQSPAKGINVMSKDDIQKFMGERFDPRRFVVRERYKIWSDLKQNLENTSGACQQNMAGCIDL